ncbi:hypothetical protein Slin15195_G000960 [Septoria linicola]|uniref:Uncharacterized protein n=1 Tax=Septoria linicola TaxID=215465 RepID=A0A9Q9ADA3_9PEZI|nr:hypothetical protein Slin14017_G000990 [Septoria linicola]USW46777.1 hypothetical protein Slin15195_G000960 [Septoria linicola]
MSLELAYQLRDELRPSESKSHNTKTAHYLLGVVCLTISSGQAAPLQARHAAALQANNNLPTVDSTPNIFLHKRESLPNVGALPQEETSNTPEGVWDSALEKRHPWFKGNPKPGLPAQAPQLGTFLWNKVKGAFGQLKNLASR